MFWLLFIVQTVGACIMLWKGVPFYRDFMDPNVQPGAPTFVWALLVVILIQPAFWWGRVHMPELRPPSTSRSLVGHLVLFVGRLIFVFVGGLFSAYFYMQKAQLEIGFGILMLIVILFSMFCYTLELERLGKNLIGENKSEN